MKNSKLLDLLRTFSPREWKAFDAFVRSPYFNRNDDLCRLCAWLATSKLDLSGIDRAAIWAALYPGQACDDKQLNHLMSGLLKLGEQFVGQERWQQTPVLSDFFTLQSLSERGLEKNYRFLADQTIHALVQSPQRDAQYYYLRYLLEDLDCQHVDRQGLRRLAESAQQAADHLDLFYFTEKLKYTCAMLNSQQAVASSFAFHFVGEVRGFLAQNPLPADAPGLGMYYSIFRMLTQETADEDFGRLKNLIAAHEAVLGKSEISVIYQYALNYCIRQTRKGKMHYEVEALDLYEKGIDSGILLQQGKLSPWHFKNIIKLALRQEKFAWTEQFILEKNTLLEADFKADALHYNLADLYFYTHRYDAALDHLNRVEFSDIHYNLGAKLMLAKIYHETDAYDALDSLLHAFQSFLHRNKVIAEAERKAYLHFVSLLRQATKALPSQKTALKLKVEREELLVAKSWLLAQLGN